MLERRVLGTCLLFLASALGGCYGGSSDDGGSNTKNNTNPNGNANVGSYCSSKCDKVHQCDSSQDTQICTNDCQNTLAAVGPKLRSDFLGNLTTCYSAEDCVSVLSGNAGSDCVAQAVASLAPTSTGTSFCDQYDQAAMRCNSSIDKAECFNNAKTFNDAALSSASACFSKPCSDIDACVSASLGSVEDNGGGGGTGGTGGTSSGGAAGTGTGGAAGTGSGGVPAGGTGSGGAAGGGPCQEGDPSSCVDSSNVSVCVDATYQTYACSGLCNDLGFAPGGCASNSCQCGDATDDACAVGTAGFCACYGACTDDDITTLYISCHIQDPSADFVSCYGDYVSGDSVDCESAATYCSN